MRQSEGEFLRRFVENARGEGIAGRQRRAEMPRLVVGCGGDPLGKVLLVVSLLFTRLRKRKQAGSAERPVGPTSA
jgi:hypothetical protein